MGRALRNKDGLTSKQRAVAIEYLANGLNAAAAYRKVYPNVKRSTSETSGPAVLRNPRAREFIDRELAKREERQWLKVDELERELHRLVHFDPARLIGADGKALLLQDIDEDTRRALSGVDVEELFAGRGEERELVGLLRKVRWHDKRAAIELAMRRRGLLVEKVEQVGPAHVTVQISLRKAGGTG